jgi:hypothetical protein
MSVEKPETFAHVLDMVVPDPTWVKRSRIVSFIAQYPPLTAVCAGNIAQCAVDVMSSLK